MADKDLLGKMNDRMNEMVERVAETNTILKEFMGVSIKQWEKQHKFNEHLFNKLDGIEKQLKG